MQKISDLCQGKWKEILTQLGVDVKYLSGKHGPCPFCGGEDRFRFTNKNGFGFYVCNQCTPDAGDGFTLLMKLRGITFGQAVRLVAPIVGYKQEPDPEYLAKKREQEQRLEEARQLWRSGKPVTRDCPAGLYLTRRTGIIRYPCSLRYVGELPYREEGEQIGTYPGILAYISGPSGQLVNIHRTFLTEAGDKAPVKNARKHMRGQLPAGSALRLGPIEDGKLLVAEGLETTISAAEMHRCTGWSLINADRMRAWVPPSGLRHVIVAGDNDASYTGQYSAYALANRLVTQFKIEKVEVIIPPLLDCDWNDWVMGNKEM